MESINEDAMSGESTGFKGPYKPCTANEEIILNEGSAIKPKWLSLEAIRRTIDDSGSPLNDRYQRALTKNPCLSGTILAVATVDESGAVTEISVKSSSADIQAFASSLLPILKKLKFPSTGKKDQFQFELNFLSN
ncbi:MAG: AgmX/PglI C-terminal domain-containing protein [Pseudomonadota bacterium]